MIKIYTSPTCSKCNILKDIMNNAKIEFEETADYSDLKELNITELPVLKTADGSIYSSNLAIAYVQKLIREQVQ